MAPLPHLFPQATAAREDYKYPHKINFGDFPNPPRDRKPHTQQLANDLGEIVQSELDTVRDEASEPPKGRVIEFVSEPNFDLKVDSLDDRRKGIEVRGVVLDSEGRMHATVFVPDDKLTHFIDRVEKYGTEEVASGKPKNQPLIESISRIRNATLATFWNDAAPIPSDVNALYWWEVWLAELGSERVGSEFRSRASRAGLTVGPDELRFPERRVMLIRGSFSEVTQIENLFDLLAEIRLAKSLASEFLDLQPPDQAEYIDEALTRITCAALNAPTVCHLDTGVDRFHPLLAGSISEEHVLAVNPDWNAADRHGHGTEMAGLALYGCLTGVINRTERIDLTHRLESVKIFRADTDTDPKLWGAISSQAVSRITIANPLIDQRVHCLTVAASARDNGLPSSWSAAIDQISAGADEVDGQRLFVVSAGNLPIDIRGDFPASQLATGIEDPGQSWNALTVGGMTNKHSILTKGAEGWETIAQPGELSPSSCTSFSWHDRAWPIKPDVVFEAGNLARNPVNGEADSLDDLSLLTTKLGLTGAFLTVTGDTSGATALASRFSAQLWSAYPKMRPETVRALAVHSARHTDAMRAMVNENRREDLLRCFGYGVPDLERATASLKSSATMVIESQLQPYYLKEDKQAATKDMHLHQLPWPTDVLRRLGEVEVRLRLTLSYFIEPSPGRKGWTKKHRYQSHGLRFDVKRPADDDPTFLKRITASAQEEDEGYASEPDDRHWTWGKQLRCKGSVHSDVWTGLAADLASAGVVAVFPVSGWWRERKHLGRVDSIAPYSFVVTIETDDVETDLYTPIEAAIRVKTEIA